VGLAVDLKDYHPSVLLHCWLGYLTCNIFSEMTYNVLSGTLNPTMSIFLAYQFSFLAASAASWDLHSSIQTAEVMYKVFFCWILTSPRICWIQLSEYTTAAAACGMCVFFIYVYSACLLSWHLHE